MCRLSQTIYKDKVRHLVQLRDYTIIENSTIILRNSSEIVSRTEWSISNPTITPVNNVTVNSTTSVNVESILNIKHNHQLKRGAGIRDSLPGIINKFG